MELEKSIGELLELAHKCRQATKEAYVCVEKGLTDEGIAKLNEANEIMQSTIEKSSAIFAEDWNNSNLLIAHGLDVVSDCQTYYELTKAIIEKIIGNSVL